MACPAATAVAWAMYSFVAMIGFFLVVVAVGTAVNGPSGAPAARLAAATALAILVAGVLGVTATGLRRRRRWALWCARAELVAGALGSIAWAMSMARNPPDPPGTDGAAYAFMGAVSWALLFGALTVPLLRGSTRRAFRPPPPGWYPDPARQARWRWWDGSAWTMPAG